MSIPRILIAGTHSGVGKTSFTAGLIRALRRRGLNVQAFKCGPDYIDPGYHSRAAGRPCRNLDNWMLKEDQVLACFQRACRGADIAIIEGVMGLYDGSSFESDQASAAQIARLFEAPVLLITDISGSGRSAAATVLGYRNFDLNTPLRGVLLNFAGSEGHARGCAEAIRSCTGLPVLGWLPRREELTVPERNLGLLTAADHQSPDKLLDGLATAVEAHCDLEAIVALARSAPRLPEAPVATRAAHASLQSPVLAVAMDEAFCFHYPDNLDLLEEAGVTIVPFSPLRGEVPRDDADGVYLGGGYPELHAATLAANTRFHESLAHFRASGRLIFAECGGFMVLTQAIEDLQGVRHPMAALIPGHTRMTTKLQAMGYRHVSLRQDCLLGAAGTPLRAHEFHYSLWEGPPADASHTAFEIHGTGKNPVTQTAGWSDGQLLGSYLHFHLGQDPRLAERLVEKLKTRVPPAPARLT